MATTQYFEETIKCQGKKEEMSVEFGRSSFYEEDSIYLNVDGKSLVMDRATAKRFIEAAAGVGNYFDFLYHQLKGRDMSALTGVLVEAHNKGVDIEALTETVSGGLMGLELYAPASAEQKPKEVESLKSALTEAQKLIAIKA